MRMPVRLTDTSMRGATLATAPLADESRWAAAVPRIAGVALRTAALQAGTITIRSQALHIVGASFLPGIE
jgi:hypothetical protein